MASIWSNGMQSWNANYSKAEEMGAGAACYTSNADYGYYHRILMCKCPVQDSFMTDGSRYEYCLNVDSDPKECQFEGSGTIYPYTNMELEFEPMTSYAYCVNVNDVSALGACQLCSCGESGVVTETSWIDYNSTAHSVYRNLVSLEETAYDQYNDNMFWSCDASITREYGCAEGYYVSEISGVDVACAKCPTKTTTEYGSQSCSVANASAASQSTARTCTQNTTSNVGEARSESDCFLTGSKSCGAWTATGGCCATSCKSGYTLSNCACNCTTNCTAVSNSSSTTSGSESCSYDCTSSIANAASATYSGSRSYTNVCNGKYTGGGCSSAGATCTGCSSWTRQSTGSCGSGSCTLNSCKSGYTKSGNACNCTTNCTSVSSRITQSCTPSNSVANAYSVTCPTGTQTCEGNYTGGGCSSAGASCTGCSKWGSCSTSCYATACKAGYYLSSGACYEAPSGYYCPEGNTGVGQCYKTCSAYDSGGYHYTPNKTTVYYSEDCSYTSACITTCKNTANRTQTRSGTESCTIANGTGSRSYTDTCNGYYTNDACASAGASCSGCSSWTRTSTGTCNVVSCNSGWHQEGNACVSNTKSCSGNLSGAQYGNITWNGSAWVYTGCYKDCSGGGIYQGYSYYTGSAWGTCKPISTTSGCHWGYYNNNGQSCDCCPAGKWCFNTQHTCPAGYFCSGCSYDPTYSGYNDQYKCPAGTYSTGGASSCTTVNDGCYADAKGSTTACPKACTGLGSSYTKSNNGRDAASDCYMSCTKACTQQATPTGAYSVTHGSTSTSGTQYYGGSCSAAASTCSLTVNSCSSGYYKDGNACKTCDSGYTSGNGMTSGRAYCYKTCASKTGYTLTGGVDYYSATDTCTYTPNTYKVTLDKQSGTGGTSEYYYQYNTKGTCYYYTSSALTTCIAGSEGVSVTVPTRTGYTFGGYYTGTNGAGTQYVGADGGTINNLYASSAANITLYAKWTPNTYKVTLDKQSGTGGTSEYYYQYNTKNSCYYYTTSALSACVDGGEGDSITVPSRTGYTFGGYYTGTNGTGTQYVDASGITRNNIYASIAANTTLYAKWTVNSYSCSAGYYLSGTSCVKCEANYYCKGGTWTYNGGVQGRNSCSTDTGGRYPYSAAGATAITSCYSGTKSRDMTSCTQNACSNPDTTGCASVTCASSCACAGTKCDYVAYSNSAGTGDGTIKSGCSTNAQSCTKGVASLTAKANRYVNGTTSCPACTSVYSGAYPYSAGGNIGSGYCYKNVTLTGTQTPCDKPNNSTEYACDTCQVGTCTYADYYSATDSVCTPANCKQSVKSGSVVCGVNYYTTGTACEQCKNAPGNAHYTGVSSSSSCPWECDSGYNQTSDNQCGQFCTSGITHIKTSTGLSIPLYSSARTSPAINIKWNNQVCYGSLVSGTASGAINVDVGGTKYHTTH